MKIWISLQILSETFLILRTTEPDIIINVHHVKCLSLLSDINGTYFSTYFRKMSDFMKIWISWKFEFLYKFLSETFLILRTTEPDIITNVLHVKCLSLLSVINGKYFSTYFRKKYQISWKFVQWKPICSMRVGRRRVRLRVRPDEANNRFPQIIESAGKKE